MAVDDQQQKGAGATPGDVPRESPPGDLQASTEDLQAPKRTPGLDLGLIGRLMRELGALQATVTLGVSTQILPQLAAYLAAAGNIRTVSLDVPYGVQVEFRAAPDAGHEPPLDNVVEEPANDTPPEVPPVVCGECRGKMKAALRRDPHTGSWQLETLPHCDNCDSTLDVWRVSRALDEKPPCTSDEGLLRLLTGGDQGNGKACGELRLVKSVE